jgi:trehalose 6-phosphate phosphatase
MGMDKDTAGLNGHHKPADLPRPHTAAGRAGLAALIAAPASALVAMDFDGTLAAIVADPTTARAYPGAASALRRLAPLVGTLAVISGRPALTVVEYGQFGTVPGMIVLGHYGRERWEAGKLTVPPAHPGVAAARQQMPAVLADAGAVQGVWTEEKGEALAIHTRRADQPARAYERLLGPLTELANRVGLVLEPGRLVIELRPPGADKGSAIADLASERAASAVLFCGDDVADVPAFAAVARMRSAGVPGLAVWSSSAEVPELAAEADLVVDGPLGVVLLLCALAEAVGQVRGS